MNWQASSAVNQSKSISVPVSRSGPTSAVRPLHVMHLVYRLQAGGMELGVIKVANGLDPRRVRSSICSTTPASAVRDLVRPDVAVFECDRRNGNDPRLVLELIRLFRRERPDIVHTHSWGTLCEGLAATRLAGVPVVLHGEHGTLQLKGHQVWVQRHAWARADCVLAVSSRLADRMAATTGFSRNRIRVIRNGVDSDRFGRVSRAEARRDLNLGDKEVVIGAVGRLVEVKDHANMLAAVAQLKSRGMRVTAVIAGDGPLRSQLEALGTTYGLHDSLRLLGYRPDVERVLAALDVFVLSSRSEGLSNTILEAMAAGLPVVATEVGGADELVDPGVTGLLVPPRDAAALADALEDLCRSRARRESFGARARSRVETDFSIRGMVTRYESLYLELRQQDPLSEGRP